MRRFASLCLVLACGAGPVGCADADSPSAGVPTLERDGGADAGGATVPADAGPPPLDAGVPQHDAAPPSDDGGAGGEPLEWLPELLGLRDFTALAARGTDLKFLVAPDTEALPPPLRERCYFQNTELYPYHLQFLRSFAGLEALSNQSYEEWVLFRSSRKFHAGVLQLLPSAVHPDTGKLGVISYTPYVAGAPGEMLKTEEVISLHAHLEGCAPALGEVLVYAPGTNAELDAARDAAEELEAAGVSFAGPSELRPDRSVEVYSEGEGYGFLRRLGPREALDAGPRDVVLTETAPSELGLVAALLTEAPQSSVSHLNLRLQEKDIPNASAPKLFDSALIQDLEGELVRVRTSGGELRVEPAAPEDAEEFWEAQRGEPKRPDGAPEVSVIAPLLELRHEDAVGYGVKAANLGELARALPDENHPVGLAIPFAAYLEHVASNDLGATVEAAIAIAARGGEEGRAALADLRDALRSAPIDAGFERRFHQAVTELWGEAGFTTRLRFRSSTNVEDLPGLSGAGLYESASGCIADDLDEDELGPSHCLSDAQRLHYEAELERRREELAAHPERAHLVELVADLEQELGEEKSARRALRKVWASLFSERAFEDREYHAIVHEAAYMGVAVHPAMVGERLEAVAITNLDSGGDAPLYRLASQLGEVGVARPKDPTAVAELSSFERSPSDGVMNVMLLQGSSLVEAGTSLWSERMLDEVGAHLFAVQDHFEREVYPELARLTLDVELDVTADGTIVVKQARPYVSFGP